MVDEVAGKRCGDFVGEQFLLPLLSLVVDAEGIVLLGLHRAHLGPFEHTGVQLILQKLREVGGEAHDTFVFQRCGCCVGYEVGELAVADEAGVGDMSLGVGECEGVGGVDEVEECYAVAG